MADFQTLIGDQGLVEGGVEHAVLHVVVGCVGAVATGADCSAGAFGGLVQSVYAGTLDGSGLTPDQMLDRVNLIAGLAGYFASGGKGENVSATASVAVSGLENNYLSHADLANLRAELEACEADPTCDEDKIADIFDK